MDQVAYCMHDITLQQCLAPADAVDYFHSPGSSTCQRKLALQLGLCVHVGL